MKHKKKSLWLWLGTVFLSGMMVLGVFLPVFFPPTKNHLGCFIFSLYSPICHQQPERSYHLHGRQLTVCSRCLGVYAGFLISALLYPALKQKWKGRIARSYHLMLYLALPMFADVLAGWLKIWQSPLFLKTVSSFMWSAVLPFFWFKGLDELFS